MQKAKNKSNDPKRSRIAGLPASDLFRTDPKQDWFRIRYGGVSHDNGAHRKTGAWSYVVTDPSEVQIATNAGGVHAKIVGDSVVGWEALAEGLTHISYLVEESFFTWGGLLLESDSDIVVRSMAGSWKCSSPYAMKLRNECLSRLATIGIPWHSRWIPREMNAECDAMAAKVARRAVR